MGVNIIVCFFLNFGKQTYLSSNPNLEYNFYLDVPLIAAVIAKTALYYGTNSIFYVVVLL